MIRTLLAIFFCTTLTAWAQDKTVVLIIDDLHEHPNALVVDKMSAGTKARRQALIFEITNSGSIAITSVTAVG